MYRHLYSEPVSCKACSRINHDNSWTCPASRKVSETNRRRHIVSNQKQNAILVSLTKMLVNCGMCASIALDRLSFFFVASELTCQSLSNPKPGHTTGRPGRGGARRGSRAERGRVERDAVGSIRPGDNPPSCSPANREHCPERIFGSTNSLVRV